MNSDDVIIEEEAEGEEAAGEAAGEIGEEDNESSYDYSDVSSIPPNSQMNVDHRLRNFSSVSLT